MRRMLIPTILGALFLSFAVLLWRDGRRLSGQDTAFLIGQPAPFDHPLIGQGHPILVNFWFSSCAPCRAEHPYLMELSERMAIVGVNRDVNLDDAAAFLEELGDPFAAQVFDPRNDVADAFAIRAWPTSILIAGNGIVQATFGPLIDRRAQSDLGTLTEPERLFQDPEAEAAAQALFAKINCLDCEANTVRESGGDFALQMRKLVRANLRAGASEAQIRDGLIARYGPHIWLDPPLNLTTGLLYALPFLVLLGGGLFLWRRGRS